MPPVESIILKTNAMVDEALSHLVHSWKNGMSQKQLLMQLQTVAGMYACQGVKRNGGHTDKGKRHQACCIAYRDVAVPGFLKWLAEEECELPPWLTKHHMGCSTMTGAGEPRLYKDGGRLYKKYTDDLGTMRNSITPVYERIIAGRPTTEPTSGNQYADQYKEFQTELWILECDRLGKQRDALDLSKEEEYLGTGREEGGAASGGSQKEQQAGGGGEGGSPEGQQTDGGGEGGSPEGQQTDGGGEGGSPGGQQAGGAGGTEGSALGPEPAAGSPEYPGWLARKAAMDMAAAETAPGRDGDSNGDDARRKSALAKIPGQPDHFMHPCTLAFCLFGRPAGKHEDIDLKHCSSTSGPDRRGWKGKRTKKEGAAASLTAGDGGGSDGGSSESSSLPENPLGPAALRQFVGAGESQSRAQVRKEGERLRQQESRDNRNKESMALLKEQARLSKNVAASVKQVADDVHAQRTLEEEEACRKRKAAAIGDLKGELEYCDPDDKDAIKAKIRDLYKKPATEFTAAKAGASSVSIVPSVATAPAGTAGNSLGS